jgi:hypothetical protein
MSPGSNWSVEGAELIQRGPGHATITFGDQTWTDYDLTLELLKIQGSDGIGVSFRGLDLVKGFVLGLGGLGNEHNLHHWSQSGDRSKIRYRPGTLQPNDWYKLKISVRGPNIVIELDGHHLFALKDTFSISGRIALHCFNCSARFRNIIVTAPDGRTLWEGLPDLTPE